MHITFLRVSTLSSKRKISEVQQRRATVISRGHGDFEWFSDKAETYSVPADLFLGKKELFL
jgi:hypothetical protein